MYQCLTIAFFFFISQVNAQTTFKYCNPKYFKGYSIVFTKEYKPAYFSLRKFNGQFTPTKEEIDSAEAIFMRRYDADINKKEAYIPTKNPIKFYKHYKRQYIGLFGSNGEKVILFQLLNNRKYSYIKEYYWSWESEFIVGTGDFYERNTVRFIVNLTTGELRVY